MPKPQAPTVYTEYPLGESSLVYMSLSRHRLGRYGSPLGDIPVLYYWSDPDGTQKRCRVAASSPLHLKRQSFPTLAAGLAWLLEHHHD